MDKVQETRSSKYNIPSPETFGIQLFTQLYFNDREVTMFRHSVLLPEKIQN
jgi:hypothetical protein